MPISDRTLAILAAAALLLGIATCSSRAAPTILPPSGGTPGIISGTARVKSIEIVLLESFPVQVQVLARGYLPDGCTKIDHVTQVREGITFRVTISTSRAAEAICTQALVPFEETIPLEVIGLKAGTYTVDVNGMTGTFTLDVDNVSQG